jgi:hypothetical protein
MLHRENRWRCDQTAEDKKLCGKKKELSMKVFKKRPLPVQQRLNHQLVYVFLYSLSCTQLDKANFAIKICKKK